MTNIYDLDTPTLLADLDRLERNLAAMAQKAKDGGKALRPHTKTHKTPEIARIQVRYGAQGLTVAKLGEAEVMADAGFDDLFIANQIVGEVKYERLFDLMRRAQVRIGVDSREGADRMGSAASLQGVRIPVMIEVDTGLGRAGIRSETEGLDLARFVTDHPGLELLGIFTHEGHLYKTGNAVKAATEVAAQMRGLAAIFHSDGLPCDVISVGSTPGAPLLASEPGLTELRPGVYVYYDRMQLQKGATPEQCALTVLATVTSVRSDGKVIVDAGTKSLASDCPFEDKTYGAVMGHPELQFVGASEEHGHLFSAGNTSLRVGDKVRIIPYHACTCVNMHDTITAFRGENVEAVWNIAARGKIR